MKIKLELSPAEVEDAVSQYVALTYGPCKTTVKLNVEMVCSGYGIAERYDREFTGATVTIEKQK